MLRLLPELFDPELLLCDFEALRCEPDFDVLRCDLDVLLLFFELLPLELDLRAGTFAPSFRASESPMAIACFGFVTFFPLPLRSLPSFISCISLWTFFCAFGPYFLPPEDL